MSGGPRHKVDPLKTRRCVFPLPEVPWRGPWTSKKAQLQWLQDGRRQTMWYPALMGTEFWCFFWMCAFCCHQSDSKIIDHSKKPMKRYRIRVVWAFGLFLPFKKDIEGNQTWEYLHMIHVFLSSNGYQPISTDLDLLSKRRLLRWQVGRVSVVFLSCKFCTRRRFEGSNKLPFLT